MRGGQHLDIPAGPEALTSEWLTQALHARGAIQNASVASFEVKPMDQGGMGQIARLTLTYDRLESCAPQSIIIKFSSAVPALREQLRAWRVYEREVGFYDHIAHRIPLRTPRCYYSDMDRQTGMHVLLLEDLAPARTGDIAAGCSVEEAELAVRQIAGLHAAYWENPQLAEMSWLPDLDGFFDFHHFQSEFPKQWAQVVEWTPYPLPGPIAEITDWYGEHGLAVVEQLFKARPRTMLHFDYQPSNMLFGTPEGGVPFAVIDWQLMTRGRGVFDVAYLLPENMRLEDRRARDMDLLRIYHGILVDSGVRGYTFDQCLRDYRLSLIFRMAYIVFTVTHFARSQEGRQWWINTALPRSYAAILDTNAGEALLH
jgi:hypothetical protein